MSAEDHQRPGGRSWNERRVREKVRDSRDNVSRPDGPNVRDTLEHADGACFARDSVVSETELMETALRYGVGYVSPEEVKRAVRQADGGILRADVDGRSLVTTREVLEEEKAMLAFARDGRGKLYALRPGVPGLSFGTPEAGPGSSGAACPGLLGPGDAHSRRGGHGQNHADSGSRQGNREAEAARKSIPSPPRPMPRAESCGGSDSRKPIPSSICWSTRSCKSGCVGTCSGSTRRGCSARATWRGCSTWRTGWGAAWCCRGTPSNTGPCARGDALRLLETYAGVRPAQVTEIIRQKGAYKEAVAALSEGKTAEGFDQLDRLGWVIEAPDEERPRMIAEDYVKLQQAGKTALVVAPTHAEGEEVTACIRDALRQEGKLGEEELAAIHLAQSPLVRCGEIRRRALPAGPGGAIYARTLQGSGKGSGFR